MLLYRTNSDCGERFCEHCVLLPCVGCTLSEHCSMCLEIPRVVEAISSSLYAPLKAVRGVDVPGKVDPDTL